MKKISKKGFTLVELLAVLIVLIVIVFIAINKINNSTQETKMNTIKANAGVFIKAVNDYLDINVINDVELPDTSYPVVAFTSDDNVKISGTKPTGGYVTLEDNEVKKACLEYDAFIVKFSKGKVKSPRKGSCNYTMAYAYEYTGEYEEFVAPFTGQYRIEAWGAKGGNNPASYGNGAYAAGTIQLNMGDKLYIYVGSKGGSTRTGVSEFVKGGFNGGGNTNGQSCCDRTYGTGGGASDVRLVSGSWDEEKSLASRILVAAGGGGGFNGNNGGNAGGLTGQNGQSGNGWGPGPGGSQTSAGINTSQDLASGSFGKGGQGGNSSMSTGGGGGYWGGAGSYHIDAAGGGSSYVSGHTGCVAIKSQTDITPKAGCDDGTTDNECSIHYSGKIFTDTVIKAGNELMPSILGSTEMTGNTGDGYVKISVVQ